jgi:hypothetical protein
MFFNQISEPVQIGDYLNFGNHKVHSCFSKVVNLIDSEGNICFVTTLQDNLAPNSIYIASVPISDIKSLEVGESFIKLNDESLLRKECLVYNSEIELNLINTDIFEQRLMDISKNHIVQFPEKSLAFLLDVANLKFFTSSFEKAFAQNALTSAELILSGEIIEGIKMIKGTGFGLTPSGDDFIAGLMFGLHYNEKKYHKNISSLKNELFEAAVGKNELVNSFLFYAKKEKYFSRLKNFVTLLSGENDVNIIQALKMLFSMGATSGADLLTGYLFSINHSVGI